MNDTEPCRKCADEISVQSIRCPSCGYEPRSRGHPLGGLLLGLILTLSVVGSVIGIPLIIASAWHLNRRKDWKPTTADPA